MLWNMVTQVQHGCCTLDLTVAVKTLGCQQPAMEERGTLPLPNKKNYSKGKSVRREAIAKKMSLSKGGVKFQTLDKWLSRLFNVSKGTWPPGSLSLPQSLPIIG